MVSHVSTVAFQGVEAVPVEVQVMVAPGKMGMQIVGLADKAVAESRERVQAALAAMGLSLPPKRITINLSPADLPKEGSHYDLPIALALLAAIYLMTTLLTEILSNNAAAVLLVSLSIGLAESIGVDAKPFLIAIAVAASASFATPIGYQTNTYVYGVGNYRFLDFFKVGALINLLGFVVSITLIPLFWSF